MKKLLKTFFGIFICMLFIQSTLGQDIYQSIRDGDLVEVKKILTEHQELLDQKNDDALTPLNLACEQGQAGIVDLLLQKGADPYLGDNENSAPLHLAAISGSLESIDLLLDHGVDIDLQDDNGMTPLLFAISRRSWASEHLIKKGADIDLRSNNGWAPVHLAIATRNDDLAKSLIESGAKLDVSVESGATPVHTAVSFGNLPMLKLLIEHGADPMAENNNGQQPLAFAVNPNTLDCAKYMIKLGAEIGNKDDHGWTALHNVAARGQSTAVAQLLLDHGADINAVDELGHNPLYAAVRSHHPDEMCRFLILNGAEINPPRCSKETPCTCYPDYSTPLHLAARHDQVQLCKDLVQNGAYLNVFNAAGQTPLHCAVEGGNLEIVKYMLDKGAFLNVKDQDVGYAELHYAAVRGYADVLNYLLDHGADPNLANRNGKTAFDLAMYYGHQDIAYDLLASGAADDHLGDYLNAPDEFELPLAYGEARLWFLGHSGWAIKTQNHLLVFDYFCNRWDRAPDDSCLSSGFINAEMLAGNDVTVFSTHAHGDHYEPFIFNWKEANPDINYVLCWDQDTEGNEYTRIPVHGEKQLGDMNIYAHYSTDLGGGYLVEVDGLTILHMGDHANGADGLMPEFTAEIDMIKERGDEIDILFGGIRGCSLGQPEQVKRGIYYTLENLKPELFVPMHCGAYSTDYKEFVETAKKDGINVDMKYVQNRGDRFTYSNNKQELSSR